MKLAKFGLALLFAPQFVFAGIELGADAGYFNPKLTARSYPALSNSLTTAFTGPLFTGYAHLTFGLPEVIRIGFGPSLGYSYQTALEDQVGNTREDATITRFGLDVKAQLELLPFISPYLRLTAGKDWIRWTDRGTATGGSYLATSAAGGFFYTAMVGFQIPFAVDFGLYLQAGYTASPESTLITRSYAVNGVNQPVNSPTVADTSYSGVIVSAGGKLSF